VKPPSPSQPAVGDGVVPQAIPVLTREPHGAQPRLLDGGRLTVQGVRPCASLQGGSDVTRPPQGSRETVEALRSWRYSSDVGKGLPRAGPVARAEGWRPASSRAWVSTPR
jgi:hypothetical protein